MPISQYDVVKAIAANGRKEGSAVVGRPKAAKTAGAMIPLTLTSPTVAVRTPNITEIESKYTDRFAPQEAMARDFQALPGLSLTDTLSTTPNIDFRRWAGGTIHIPTGSSITSLTFHVALEDGIFIPLFDTTPAAVVLTVAASGAYPVPDACFGNSEIKIVVNVSGVVDINLKA